MGYLTPLPGKYKAVVGAGIAVLVLCASATVGATWFAVGTVVNIAVGRMTFALGMAVGLAALLTATRGRRRLAFALCIACPLASPVAVDSMLLIRTSDYLYNIQNR